MKKITVKTFVSPIRFNSARLSLLAIVALFAYFALPANAQTPNAFWQTDTSKIEFLSPQTNSRPDIFWMRGGQVSASNGLAFIENGQKLVSLADSIVKIFRTSDGMLLRSIAVPGATEGFAVSIDGQRVAVGTSISGVHGISIYSLSNSSLLLSIPTNFAPISISFSPADNQIIAGALMGGNWNTAAMFDSVNRNFIRFIMHNSLRVGGYVAFSPDGQTFAVHEELAGGGGALALLNSSTGAWIKTYANVEGIVSFSPDGMKLATANGGNVTVFSALCAPGSCNAIFSGIAGNSNPAFSSNSQLLAIIYGSGRISVWNTSNTAVGWSQNNDYVITQNGYNCYGSHLAFAPDNTLVSAASQITLSISATVCLFVI